MFRIGVFAHLGEVSVRTLRFYDERGLIKPACTDAQTGYRYYTAEQLPCLLQIIALRDLGFSLDEIATALHQPLAPDQFVGLLTAKRDEVSLRLQRDTEILARIEARLADVTQKDKIVGTRHEVKIKGLPPVLVASARATIPTCECGMVNKTLRGLFEELFAYIARQKGAINGPTLDRWLDGETKNADMVVEACIPVAAPLAPSGNLHTYALPAVEAAAWAIHRGHSTKD